MNTHDIAVGTHIERGIPLTRFVVIENDRSKNHIRLQNISSDYVIEESRDYISKALQYKHMTLFPYVPVVGAPYNWKAQTEKLKYLGQVGLWHQFALITGEYPDKVWCEVRTHDLHLLEPTEDKV